MEHPRWDHPIRRLAANDPEGRLSDDDWLYVLDVKILEDEVDRVPSSDKLGVFLKEVRRLRRVGELPRPHRPKTGGSFPRTQRGWLSDDESTMAAAVSDAMLHRALADEEIQRVLALAQEQLPGLTPQQARDHWTEGVGFFPASFVKFVVEVADAYGWEAEYAAMFLATGTTPLVEPLRAAISIREFPDEHGADAPRSRARIVLEFDPWMSKETVATVYEAMRKELVGKGRKRPAYRELEVFRFVLARLKFDGKPVESWPAIQEEWNKKHAGTDWTYAKPRAIKRAYDSVRERLINAVYNSWGTEPDRAPPPGGSVRGTRYQIFVDPRERSPKEAVLARQAGQRRQ